MSPSKFDSFVAANRKRFHRCLLRHGLLLVVLLALFGVTGHFLKGFDAKHLTAEVLILSLVVSFHLGVDHLLRRLEERNQEVTRRADGRRPYPPKAEQPGPRSETRPGPADPPPTPAE